MGRFNQYLGKTEMEVDGQKLELDVKLKDLKAIMTATKGKEITPEAIEILTTAFKDIMKRSYPDENAEEMDAFIEKKFTNFMTEFSIAMGWTTRKQMETSFLEGGEPITGGEKAQVLRTTQEGVSGR